MILFLLRRGGGEGGGAQGRGMGHGSTNVLMIDFLSSYKYRGTAGREGGGGGGTI